MPGLAGKVWRIRRDEEASSLLDRFRAALSLPGVELTHRAYAAENCVVSIALTGIVPASTSQPASEPSRGAVLFLEGEIFNLAELGSDLGAAGGAPPAEIALKLLLRDGFDAVSRFGGNFVLLLYEPPTRRLTVFNDRFAARPFYYLEEDGALVFGSEKKSILAVARRPPRVDGLGLLQVFAHRHNLSGRTFLEGLRCLRPGSRLEYDASGLRVSRYARLAFRPSPANSIAERIEEGAEKLRRAVARRVHPERGVVLNLSGGLDSRAIACSLSRALRPVFARTRAYADSGEYLCAAQVARRLGFEHFREDPDAVPLSRILPAVVWRTEGGVVFLNCTSIVSHRLLKEHGDILLGGHYGDISSGAHIYPYMFLPRSRDDFVRRAFHWYLVYDRDDLRCLFTEDFLEENFPRLEEAFHESLAGIPGTNIEAYQLWDLEERQARMTICAAPVDSHLFEAPYPFLDAEYIDFCLSLSTALRFRQVFYRAMIYRLGPEIRDVPCANTGLRLRGSVAGNRASALYAEIVKAGTKAVRKAFPRFRSEGIRRALEEEYAGGRDRSDLLAILATFAVAFRYFVGKRPSAPPAELDSSLRIP